MNKAFLIHRPASKGFLTLLLGLFLAANVEAQRPDPAPPSGPLSLNQCIAYALRNHKSIDNARFDTYIAQKQVVEFKSVGLPQVGVNAQFQQYGQFPTSVLDIKNFSFDPNAAPFPSNVPDSIRYQTAQFGVKYNASVTGQVSQLLYDGSFFVGLKAAAAFVELTEINVQRTEEEAALRVTQAYYGALLNAERAKLLTANVGRLEKLLQTTQALYDQGFIEKVDVDRLRITLNNLKAEERKVARMVGLGYDLLKFQMGMPVVSELTLSEQITDVDQVPPISEIVLEGDFHEERTEMELFRQQIKLNQLNTKRQQIGITGTLSAFGQYSYQTFRPRFFSLDIPKKWFPMSLWGISYNLTIFDGFRKSAGVAKSRLEVAKIENQMAMFEEAVRMEARNAVTSVMNAWSDVENARQNMDLSKEVYRISTTKYQEGIGSNLEVIDAENTLMETQVNYLASLYSYILATVELRRVKGEIDPAAILQSVPEN